MLFFVCLLFFISTSLCAGFSAETKVRMKENQYICIKDVTSQYYLESYFFDTKSVQSDVYVAKKKYNTIHALKIYFDDEFVVCAPAQLFFDVLKNQWVAARNIRVGDLLLSAIQDFSVCVTQIEESVEQIDLYDLSMMQAHTFLVTRKDIVVHNFFPFIGITILWGGGIEWAVTGGIAILGSYFAAKFTGKDKNVRFIQGQVSSSGFPDPDDDDNDPFKKWRHLSIKEITNKIAKKIAKELGFEETKDFNFNSHGQKVFKKGNDYITLDKTSHKGGVWKMYDNFNRRLGTYSIDLLTKISD